MPTMPERMATVEAEIKSVKADTSETKIDVKALLAWRDEERGARRQRYSSIKALTVALTVLTIALNVVLKVWVP